MFEAGYGLTIYWWFFRGCTHFQWSLQAKSCNHRLYQINQIDCLIVYDRLVMKPIIINKRKSVMEWKLWNTIQDEQAMPAVCLDCQSGLLAAIRWWNSQKSEHRKHLGRSDYGEMQLWSQLSIKMAFRLEIGEGRYSKVSRRMDNTEPYHIGILLAMHVNNHHQGRTYCPTLIVMGL